MKCILILVSNVEFCIIHSSPAALKFNTDFILL